MFSAPISCLIYKFMLCSWGNHFRDKAPASSRCHPFPASCWEEAFRSCCESAKEAKGLESWFDGTNGTWS